MEIEDTNLFGTQTAIASSGIRGGDARAILPRMPARKRIGDSSPPPRVTHSPVDCRRKEHSGDDNKDTAAHQRTSEDQRKHFEKGTISEVNRFRPQLARLFIRDMRRRCCRHRSATTKTHKATKMLASVAPLPPSGLKPNHRSIKSMSISS
jgi:hypothetical protein